MAEELTDEEFETYSRQIVLNVIGLHGQEKLKKSRVAVVGVGGLGSPVATLLTAMGVGYIRLIDRDLVERSNLHRQHLYTSNDVGYPKVEIAAKRLRELNPYVEIDPLPLFIDDSTVMEAVRDVDVVVDGLDNFKARRAVNRACYKLSIPYIYASAIETYGSITTIIPGKGPCLECIFPNVSDEGLPTCSIVGVHPSILQIISGIEVYEAINILTKKNPILLGKLLLYDLVDLSSSMIDVNRSRYCPVCRELEAEREEIKYPIVEEVCAREGLATFMINPGQIKSFNLHEVVSKLNDPRYKLTTNSKLGVTLQIDRKIKFSLLITGVAIVEGVESREEALKIYTSLVESIINK
ncbi:MAG: HesA/MoeB/ThiF family protein [Nitrososphaerota archaeon]|nr:HesA/MoeB/ThiF family protein [Nitrososphaerota archaeon]